jgi:hypothetical protein
VSKNRIRAAWVAIVLSTAFLGISDAHAERIVLLQFTGRKASVLRDKVAASLRGAGHTVIRSKVSSRRVSAKALGRAGKRADAVVGGKVESARKGDWSIALRVNDPKQGTLIGEEIRFSSGSLAGLTTDVSDNVARRVEALLTAGTSAPAEVAEPTPAPPASAATEATVATSEENATQEGSSDGEVAADGDGAASDAVGHDTDEGSDASPKGQRTLLRLSARAGYLRRDFDFYDDLYAQLRKLSANSWVYAARGELSPFKGKVGQRVGFVLSYEGTLAGHVRDPDARADYPVLHNELFGGVLVNYPLGAYELGLELTVGRMTAGLDDANQAAGVPELQYTELRSALDVKRDMGSFNVAASIGLRLPLGFGEASETRWFPRMGGYGVEAGVQLGYRLSQRVTLEAAGSLRRYLLEMHSKPEDAMTGASQVAGGAVDRFLTAYLGASYSL